MTTTQVEPQVIRVGLCTMQVCVPEHFTDDEVAAFANRDTPTGIESRWSVCDPRTGDPRRVACSMHIGFVHILLEC